MGPQDCTAHVFGHLQSRQSRGPPGQRSLVGGRWWVPTGRGRCPVGVPPLLFWGGGGGGGGGFTRSPERPLSSRHRHITNRCSAVHVRTAGPRGRSAAKRTAPFALRNRPPTAAHGHTARWRLGPVQGYAPCVVPRRRRVTPPPPPRPKGPS